MKKIILFFAGFLMIAGLGFAQTSDMYFKSVPITKVYNHQLGFRVVYMKSNQQMAVFYVPKSWFEVAAVTGSAPKAEVVYGNDDAYPYFSIFWKDGEFDHIRLYLQSDLNDPSWGDIDPDWGDLTDKFKVDTLKLEF